MGSGKSTLGAMVAARLGLPFVDTDREIEREAGRTVAELFSSEGEPAFRARERAVALHLMSDGVARVVAFGGGTVTNDEVRHAALDAGTLVTLRAAVETLVARTSAAGATRPLLGDGSTEATLQRLRELSRTRAAAYAECHGTVGTDRPLEDALEDVLRIVARRPIAMPLGERSYVVDVVDGDPSRSTEAIAALRPSSLIVVTDTNVAEARNGDLASLLGAGLAPSRVVTLPPGEVHKTLPQVAAIWDAALGQGIDRNAVVVTFGGGVVGDMGGFAASTLLRGIRFVQLPTTLLAMVDASVGGKTGFDHEAGKNLVGTFHQPSHVVADLAHLSTLPDREVRAGLAEVVKIALTCDATLFEDLERAGRTVLEDRVHLRAVVRRAIELKARVVRQDEREAGLREILNFGHTVGHAVESGAEYTHLLHGEAIAMGMVAELALGERLGLSPSGLRDRTARLLEALGMRAEPSNAEMVAARPFLGADKKRRGTHVRVPLPSAVGACTVHPLELALLEDGPNFGSLPSAPVP